MLDHIGESFDRYQIEEFIRQDIWGVVYRAYDPKFARKVAVQVLDSELSSQPKTVESYLQLARTVLRWRHPGIIRFFDFGEVQGKIFTVQEYFPGPDLHQALEKLQTQKLWLPLSEAIQLMVSVCQALDYAHQRGVRHQNLKAENILLSSEPGSDLPYQPVLINLGFGLTSSNGNPDLDVDVQEDIYSAGKLLLRLVCGTEFDEGNKTDDESSENAAVAALIRQSRPDLPHSLERIILQALDAGSQTGYQSIQDLGTSLKQAVQVAARITTTPSGFENVVSLSAIIQDSKNVKPAPDAKPTNETKDGIEETPPTSGDTIHILLPDQIIRSIPISALQMSIGRGSENDIVLDENGVSRHHALIDFDGEQYQVTDLKSTNGVFIDDFRLPPETPHPWLPGENLRIGEVWLRIEKAEQEQSTIAIPSVQPTQKIEKTTPPKEPSPADEIQEKPKLDFNYVSAFTIDSNLMVTPGKSVSAPVVLYNRSTKADIYYLELDGIPDEWAPNRPVSASVPANGQKEITLVFRPPRAYTSRAGRHAIIFRITSQNDPAQIIELRLTLTISAFTQFSSELQPKQLKAGDAGTLLIRNMGNIPETFSLSWEDRLGELAFDPKRATATVPPGETVKVPYQVSRAQTLWFGGEKINSFKVNISSQSAQAQSHTGSFFSKALIPPWALIALISLCLILSCVLVIFSNQLLGAGPDVRATDRASQTAGALVNQQTAQAITATASAILSGNQATIQAITATAVWREGDDDGDGLNNGQEILLNTLPNVTDTDEDGLSDGDEVNLYRTNPIISDSDGDGLKDGEEIQRRTDPMRRDTDGDGIEDAVDTDPLATSTPTQLATSTLTVTPTASSTATVTPTATHPPNVANLSLTLTNNTTSSIPGANTAYSLQVRNNSPITVNNIQVIDTFPSILLNVTWNCLASSGSVCQSPSGLGNMDTRINLSPSGSATFTISATILPTATGLLINSAQVVMPAGMTDPDPSDNQAMDTDSLTPMVNLSISKTDNRTTIEPGDALSYTVNVTNSGPSAVIGLTVNDFFSDALTNISWECKASSGSSCAVNGVHTGNISTDVNLNPGGSATFTINATIKNSASGVLTNTASLISPINPAVNNKTATDTTNIVPKADLSVSVSAPVSAAVSTQMTLTITVTNQGPSNVTGLTLVDGLPTGTTYLSSNPGAPVCSMLLNTLTCALGDLAAGGQKTVTILLTTPTLPGTISNLVNVTANQADPDMTNNLESTEILIN